MKKFLPLIIVAAVVIGIYSWAKGFLYGGHAP